MAVSVETEPTFSAGKPTSLFEAPFEDNDMRTVNYDVTRDDGHFIFVKRQEESTRPQINVVLTWFDELKRLTAIK
jgi:hypothetical protein